MALTSSTAIKMKRAILALMSGASDAINKKNGKFIPNNKTTDPFRTNPVNNQTTHNDEFSSARHLTSKQKVIEYETEGMNQNINVESDPVTNLPKYIINIENQPDRDLEESSDEGAVPNQELDVRQTKVPIPHDFSNDLYLQSIVNSMVVSIANSVAEAVTDIIIAKFEENQTEIEIEWDPVQKHKIETVNMNGPVVPGNFGSVNSSLGTISFKNGFKYKHKCKIKFSDL